MKKGFARTMCGRRLDQDFKLLHFVEMPYGKHNVDVELNGTFVPSLAEVVNDAVSTTGVTFGQKELCFAN